MGAAGKLPKPDEERQRRNPPTVPRTELGTSPASSDAGLPDLKRAKRWRTLHTEARKWWTDLLESPMASQYLRVDWRRLRALLELHDRYWKAIDADEVMLATNLARELRQQEREFGLTPDSRARMNWQVRAPSAPAEGEKPAEKSPVRRVQSDPRRNLKAVS